MNSGSGIRLRILAGILVAAGAAYAALWPTLRHMMENAARLNREAAAALTRSTVAPSVPFQTPPSSAESERAAKAAVQLHPENSAAWIALAELQRRERHYYDAVKTYGELLARFPNDPTGAIGLGSLYISFGWTLDALDVLRQAVRVHPDRPEAKVALALAYSQHDDTGDAEKQLLEVRRSAANAPSLWSPLVDLYNTAHRYRDAISTAQAILRSNPDDVNVTTEMGQAYLQAGDFANAMSAYQRALAVSPTSVPAHYGLAQTYQREGREQDALIEFKEVARSAPDFQETELLLSQILLRSNRAAEGRGMLADYRRKKAVSARLTQAGYRLSNHTHDSSAHWQMAQAYEAAGDLPHALLELHRTLELDPHNAAARQHLDTMTR